MLGFGDRFYDIALPSTSRPNPQIQKKWKMGKERRLAMDKEMKN